MNLNVLHIRLDLDFAQFILNLLDHSGHATVIISVTLEHLNVRLQSLIHLLLVTQFLSQVSQLINLLFVDLYNCFILPQIADFFLGFIQFLLQSLNLVFILPLNQFNLSLKLRDALFFGFHFLLNILLKSLHFAIYSLLFLGHFILDTLVKVGLHAVYFVLVGLQTLVLDSDLLQLCCQGPVGGPQIGVFLLDHDHLLLKFGVLFLVVFERGRCIRSI